MTSTPGTESTPPADPQIDPVDRMVEMVTQSVGEWATAAKSSFDRALAGGYAADDLASDLSGAVARGVRDWARAVSVVSSMVTAVSSTPPAADTATSVTPPAATEPAATPPPVTGAPPPEVAGGVSAEGGGS